MASPDEGRCDNGHAVVRVAMTYGTFLLPPALPLWGAGGNRQCRRRSQFFYPCLLDMEAIGGIRAGCIASSASAPYRFNDREGGPKSKS